MNEIKKKRVRAIIFFDNKIVSMYRELGERKFYVFPGGGVEENETEEACVRREVFEEFGITIDPIKKVYIYYGEKSLEYFYLCEWIAGEFGTGAGEEFQQDRNNGVYKPTLIEILDIPALPLMPPEIADVFFEDYTKNGKILRNDVRIIKKKSE